ncbi:MAG: baseplate J/gp47 family protein [Methylotenera sp.]|nr:baseplate J/gp47 family protein [Methylotenera sp.]
MPDFIRPSYLEIKARIEADLSAMPAALREPIAAANAREFHGEYGYLDWIRAQCSPLTCELEMLYVWASLYFVERLAATTASGIALATGNIGAVVLADTLLRGDNGLDYKVINAVTLGAGSNAISLRCTIAGINSNLIAGQTLTLIDPIAGVDSTFTVDTAGLTGGAEIESLDAWRVRVVDEWQVIVSRGTRSGKPDDYRAWAKRAHPSVTTALVQPHALGLGTVVVRPICNGLANRLPTAAVITEIQAIFADLAPATADWRVVAPLVHNIQPSIYLLPGFDTAANRAAIISAINTTILAETSENAIVAMAELDAAIATVTTQYTRIAPLADINIGAGEVFVLAGVTWIQQQ